MPEITGATAVTVKGRALEVALPGCSTVTAALPTAASNALGTTAVSWLGIEERRILPLRVGALASEGGVVGDGHLGQTARDCGGHGLQAGNGEDVLADGEGVFAGL